MSFFLNKIKSLVRWCNITGKVDNAGQFPIQQIVYKNKTANAVMIFPYGVYAHAPGQDNLSVLFSIEGLAENKAVMPIVPKLRPRDLEQNEVAFYHPFTESFIKFRNNGDLEIQTTTEGTQGKVLINCIQANIIASESVSVTSPEIALTADTSITLDTPIATFTTDVQIDGALNVDGATSLSSTVTSGGTNISDNHTHPQADDSGGNTEQDTGGAQ